jgi:hypothetical protein
VIDIFWFYLILAIQSQIQNKWFSEFSEKNADTWERRIGKDPLALPRGMP